MVGTKSWQFAPGSGCFEVFVHGDGDGEDDDGEQELGTFISDSSSRYHGIEWHTCNAREMSSESRVFSISPGIALEVENGVRARSMI